MVMIVMMVVMPPRAGSQVELGDLIAKTSSPSMKSHPCKAANAELLLKSFFHSSCFHKSGQQAPPEFFAVCIQRTALCDRPTILSFILSWETNRSARIPVSKVSKALLLHGFLRDSAWNWPKTEGLTKWLLPRTFGGLISRHTLHIHLSTLTHCSCLKQEGQAASNFTMSFKTRNSYAFCLEFWSQS